MKDTDRSSVFWACDQDLHRGCSGQVDIAGTLLECRCDCHGRRRRPQ